MIERDLKKRLVLHMIHINNNNNIMNKWTDINDLINPRDENYHSIRNFYYLTSKSDVYYLPLISIRLSYVFVSYCKVNSGYRYYNLMLMLTIVWDILRKNQKFSKIELYNGRDSLKVNSDDCSSTTTLYHMVQTKKWTHTMQCLYI